jgi:hypothetical protein
LGSLDPDSTGVVHNGADDNASGATAILQVAQTLASRSADNSRTIVFVAFTAEELGLIGSDYYVKNAVRPIDDTFAMVNFDMVGRLRNNKLIVIGTGSAVEFDEILARANEEHQLALSPVEDPWGRSDHSSFYAASIPVFHLFTDLHEDYHRTSDDWEAINIEGIVAVSNFASDLVWNLATRTTGLTFQDVPRVIATGGAGERSYLGSIPDMSGSSLPGVRFTGVSADSPADRAGLRAGDVLVRLGEHSIGNLQEMTNALHAYRPGDIIEAEVIRDETRMTFTVTLGKRGN